MKPVPLFKLNLDTGERLPLESPLPPLCWQAAEDQLGTRVLVYAGKLPLALVWGENRTAAVAAATKALGPLAAQLPGTEAACAAGPLEGDGAINKFLLGDKNAASCFREAVVYGTPWQLEVWSALVRIPFGTTLTYSGLAERLQKPRNARAVGSAVGANRLAALIPCHRVVSKTKGGGGFRWGQSRKEALLGLEQMNPPVG